jgi:hypothetical protein
MSVRSLILKIEQAVGLAMSTPYCSRSQSSNWLWQASHSVSAIPSESPSTRTTYSCSLHSLTSSSPSFSSCSTKSSGSKTCSL